MHVNALLNADSRTFQVNAYPTSDGFKIVSRKWKQSLNTSLKLYVKFTQKINLFPSNQQKKK